jgi:hypothetical protein
LLLVTSGLAGACFTSTYVLTSDAVDLDPPNPAIDQGSGTSQPQNNQTSNGPIKGCVEDPSKPGTCGGTH